MSFKTLTTNFKGDLDRVSASRSFPDEYFTCKVQCTSCNARCEGKTNHPHNEPHRAANKCVYKKHCENKRLFCRK